MAIVPTIVNLRPFMGLLAALEFIYPYQFSLEIGHGRGRLKHHIGFPGPPADPDISQPSLPSLFAFIVSFEDLVTKQVYSHFCGFVPARTLGTTRFDTAAPVMQPTKSNNTAATVSEIRFIYHFPFILLTLLNVSIPLASRAKTHTRKVHADTTSQSGIAR